MRYKPVSSTNYEDRDATMTAIRTLTVQRFSKRLVLSIAASLENMTCHTQHIIQAYTQSTNSLEHKVFIRLQTEMGLPASKVLKVVKLLRAIPGSGSHCYVTYREYYSNKTGMPYSRADPYLLYRQDVEHLGGILILKIDDSLIAGLQSILKDEERECKELLSKLKRL